MRRSPALLLGLLLAAGCRAPATLPEAPSEYVTDRAGVLEEAVERDLNTRLRAFEAETSNQVVVYADRTLPEGRELEELAVEAFEEWGIGQADRDNGVLFLIFIEDRQARIEVGYGLEGALPDALANQVLQEQAVPSFRDGDWETGIVRGVEGIVAATRGEYEGEGEPSPAGGGERSGGFPWFALFALLFLLPPLLRGFGRSRRYGRGRTYGGSGWWVWPLLGSLGGGRGGYQRGGGGGFGGFSGGGGLSGGGGASGRW